MVMAKDKQTLDRKTIIEYVWARYVDNVRPRIEIDEEAALKFFEDYYAKHPLNSDEECFYYGILLYERAFSDDANRARYLVKASEVFDVYRRVTGETEWDVVEDRYADTLDLIESEGLRAKVKTVTELAPEVEGMVLVPGGPFLFGEEKKETVLEPFYIDVRPVTNAQYRAFVEETHYRSPELWKKRPDLASDDLPVTGVSWMDALQYCKWAGKSLPTAEQWEKAARGPDGNLYPWGDDEPTPETCNVKFHPDHEPVLRRVDDFKGQASPYGVLGMAGFVWEWTNTPYPDEDGAQVVKGGSYVDPPFPEFMATYASIWANKKEKSDIIGFRCTRRLEL